MSTITSAKSQEQPRAAGTPFQETIIDRAKEMVGAAADKVGVAASAVTRKADQAVAAAGSNIKSFGEAIQEKGPQEGVLGNASHRVGGTIEAGGKYLEEQGVSGMMDDLAGVIKRNPVPAILVGVGVGVLIGRALRR